MDLLDKLRLANETENIARNGNQQKMMQPQYQQPIFEQQQQMPSYDPNEEMKRIKERQNGSGSVKDSVLSNNKMPKAILESILNEPLNVEPMDSKMDEFTEGLAKKMSPQMANMMKINESLNKKDANDYENRIIEQRSNNNTAVVDYSLIKQIVENAIDRRIGNLNESLNHESNNPSLKCMKMGESFLFLDSQDNIYECKMVYKGKNKARKKKRPQQ